jgi:hypothetical protein
MSNISNPYNIMQIYLLLKKVEYIFLPLDFKVLSK